MTYLGTAVQVIGREIVIHCVSLFGGTIMKKPKDKRYSIRAYRNTSNKKRRGEPKQNSSYSRTDRRQQFRNEHIVLLSTDKR